MDKDNEKHISYVDWILARAIRGSHDSCVSKAIPRVFNVSSIARLGSAYAIAHHVARRGTWPQPH